MVGRSKDNRAKRGLAGAFAPSQVACVWIPQFEVQVERARHRELERAPLALIARMDAREPVVRACSAEVQAAGIAPGDGSPRIAARRPDAVLLPYDSRWYDHCYEELLAALDAVTPLIETQPLEAFYLDLSGLPHLSAHDPQGVHRLVEAVRAVFPPHLSVRIGVASGKFTAWVAANMATAVRPLGVPDDERALLLQDAPSSLLPVEPEMAERLHLLGLRTLGSIARMPRTAMLAQFGWEGERAHRLACGEDREPLEPHIAPHVIRETLAFSADAPTVAHFHLALYWLIHRACARPERHGRGVRQVRLEAGMEDGDVWERTLTLRRPTEQADEICEELKRRLESVRPTGCLREMTAELTAFAARLDVQRLLFDDTRQHRRESLAHELEQLRNRLGRSAVYRIVEVEPCSRLPEKQYGLVSYDL